MDTSQGSIWEFNNTDCRRLQFWDHEWNSVCHCVSHSAVKTPYKIFFGFEFIISYLRKRGDLKQHVWTSIWKPIQLHLHRQVHSLSRSIVRLLNSKVRSAFFRCFELASRRSALLANPMVLVRNRLSTYMTLIPINPLPSCSLMSALSEVSGVINKSSRWWWSGVACQMSPD